MVGEEFRAAVEWLGNMWKWTGCFAEMFAMHGFPTALVPTLQSVIATQLHNHYQPKALVGQGPSNCLTAHKYVGLMGFLELGYMVTPQEIEPELNLPLFCDILMAVSQCSHLSASFFWGLERWFVPTNARNVAAELNACTRPWKACKARVGSFRSCQQLWNRIYIYNYIDHVYNYIDYVYTHKYIYYTISLEHL